MKQELTRRTTARLAGSALATWIVSPAFTGGAQAATLQKQTLQKVPFAFGTGAFYFIIPYLADAAGYIRQEGLELDAINVSSGPRQVAAIMGGSVDAGPLGLQLVVQAGQHTRDVVAICAGYNILPMGVVLSNQAIARTGITESMSTDQKVARLRGLRIGITTPGSGTDDMVRALLRNRGMDASKDLTIQPLVSSEGMVAALERGASDGFCFTSPINEMVVSRGLGKIIIEPLNGDVPEAANVPYIVLATSRDTIANKRPMLLGLVRAYTKAMALVQNDPKQAAKLVKPYFEDVDQATYDLAFAKYIAGVPKTPLITPEQVQNVVKFMQISKGLPIAATFSEVVDTSFATEVLKQTAG